MNKDVVYIDVEDDITAIIGKVKSSREKIVALVPPKRIGVLQSAVNLRLLQRAATQSDKRIVLITNNQALMALSAAASIPVAKNLQSKPGIAEIPALDVDNGEDVIDGSKLPVGDHAKAVDPSGDTDDGEVELIQGINLDEVSDKPAAAAIKPRPIKKTSAQKVPDFNRFRKKIFIGLATVLLLTGTLIWAFVFAPAATVVITARTTPVPVSGVVALGTVTNAEAGTIKTAVQTVEEEATVDFEATGEEDQGTKASGRVTLSIPCSAVSSGPPTIPAGTGVSSGGKTFITQTSATLSSPAFSPCRFTTTVDVTAGENGDSFNLPADAAYTVAGYSSVTGVGSAMTGGTSKIVTIVTAADVQSAKEKLVAESTDKIRGELKAKFGDNVEVIDASFIADRQEAVSSPAVGEEASDKKAKLTSKVTYRLNGIEESELETYLTEVLKKQMQDQTTQKVYKTGIDDLRLNDFARRENALSIRLVTTGHIGPVIDEDEVKETVAGKRFGDIQGQLTTIDGVSDVDVKFPFFWVRTVPDNVDKITVEFSIENASE